MNSYKLFHFLIILIVYFINYVFGVSEDCRKLNRFTNNLINSDCCIYTKEPNCLNENYMIESLDFSTDYFNGTTLDALDYNKLPLFQNLKHLIIYDSHNVTLNHLLSLTNLEDIYLTDGELTILPENFEKNKSLKKINFYRLTIKGDIFQLLSLPNLKEFKLECGTNIKLVLPKEINKNSPIETLEIDCCNINYFPVQFLDLPNLKSLIISVNFIQEIPDDINLNSSIESIDLSSNKLVKYPSILMKLPHLVELNLSSNSISDFSFQNDDIQKLKLLDISKNGITGNIVLDLTKFPLLENLNVEQNDLSGEIIISRRIKRINVDYNKFNKISLHDECDFQNMEELYMTYNNISYDSIEDIMKLKNLKVLRLPNNSEIKKIPQTIGELSKLETLDLSNTGITELPSNLFKLTNLNLLIINNNSQLNLKLIKFESCTPNYCSFNDFNTACIEDGACNSYDDVFVKQARACSKEEIEEIKRSQIEISNSQMNKCQIESNNESKNKNTRNDIFIMVVIVIISIIIIISAYIFYRYLHRRKNNNNINQGNSIVVSERVIILPDRTENHYVTQDELLLINNNMN